jgi:enoyl-CoA hydratase
VIEVVDHDGWAEIRLDRADKRNALSHALVDQLLQALDRCQGAERSVVVLGANGPVFCAGGDRSEAGSPPAASDRLLAALAAIPLFLVARVEGPVLGAGVALVRMCPVAVGTPAATCTLPEASMGNFPVPAPYLEGVVDRRRILEVGIRSTPISAEEAAAGGLLNRVVDPDELDAEVADWVARLRERPAVTEQARRYWQREVEREVAPRARWLRDLVVGEGQA